MNINNAVMKDLETKPLREIIKMPPHAIQGVSEGDSKHLKEAFGVDTVEELANLKYVKIAQALVALAATEE
ncbi:MAG: hypothetical protein AAGI46_09545 [Planctomycetota bacterium]